jgi:hypothetical protein
MNDEIQKKVQLVAKQISFLMHHQEILPDLKELISTIPTDTEYGQGAYDGLMTLIDSLDKKGYKT